MQSGLVDLSNGINRRSLAPFIDTEAGSGFLYLIQFSCDVVKIGRTHQLLARMNAHIAEASAYQARIVSLWLSEPRSDYVDLERGLLAYAASNRVGRRARKEYFHGADFAVLVQAAEDLCRSTTTLDSAPGKTDASPANADLAPPAEANQERASSVGACPAAPKTNMSLNEVVDLLRGTLNLIELIALTLERVMDTQDALVRETLTMSAGSRSVRRRAARRRLGPRSAPTVGDEPRTPVSPAAHGGWVLPD